MYSILTQDSSHENADANLFKKHYSLQKYVTICISENNVHIYVPKCTRLKETI